VAGLADRGFEDTAIEAAISKVLSTEALWRTADEALQIAGGLGYMRELPYERAVRDARINRIFEGTNEILRLFIALSAMHDVAEELKDLAASIKLREVLADPVKGFGVLSDYAKRRASLATGLRREKGKWTLLAPAVAEEAALFEACATDLALATDRLLRRHGKKIVEEQLPTRRLADVMIDLFALAAMLARVSSRVEDHGEAATTVEREILRTFARQARRRVSASLASLDENEDANVDALASHVLETGRYAFDNI
jgi:acyl-CoA dehydrogenase family protein 9